MSEHNDAVRRPCLRVSAEWVTFDPPISRVLFGARHSLDTPRKDSVDILPWSIKDP